MKASHKKTKVIVGYQEVDLEPGQFVFGRKKAAKDLKMSERSIRTCLDFLKNAGNLASKPTNKFTIITVCNWGIYQNVEKEERPTNDQQLTNKRPTTDHIQEYKERKNIKKKDIYMRFGENQKVLLTYSQVKKLVQRYGKPFTKKCIEKLDNGIASKGYKYKSHYAAINSWVVRAVKEDEEKENKGLIQLGRTSDSKF